MKTNIWITEKAQMFWKHFRNKYMQRNGFNIRFSVRWLWYKYNLYIYITSNELYVWPMTYLIKSSHNLRLHTYIQKITTPRGYHYKIRMKIQKKNYKHCQLWIYLDAGLWSSQGVMEYSDVPRPNAFLACSVIPQLNYG